LRIVFASLVAVVFLTACTTSSTPPPPRVPAWDTIPPHVVQALCARLRMDAIATGTTTLVRVTQPLVTAESLAAVAQVTPKPTRHAQQGPIVNRAIPVDADSHGSCSWRLIDAGDPHLPDDMVVELSAPLANPFARREAGVFARVSLGTEHESWYWISLVPGPGGQWGVRFVSVLFR
jgi:hypothetical protein